MGRESSIRVLVHKHAAAPTREDGEAFYFTPTQAGLAWWGLHALRTQIAELPESFPYDEEYADALRCRADAIDWVTKAMTALAAHAKNHKVEIAH